TKEAVLEALKGVDDPELHKSLVDLGMIHEIEIAGDAVKVTVALTMAGCPLKNKIRADVEDAVRAIKGVSHVEVVLGTMTSEERARLMGEAPSEMDGMKGIKYIIAIGSGKGGVGKTTVTVNLAIALKNFGARVGILDADMHGPDIPIMLGIDEHPVGMGGMLLPLEKYGVKMMSAGSLAGAGAPIIWRGPLVNKAIKEFLGHVMWGDLDYLLIDLPPGTGDAAITVANTIPLNGVIMVTTPQKVALEDVRRAIGLFRSKDIRVLGIVENMSFFRLPGEAGEMVDIFGSGGGERLAKAFKVPLLGKIPIDPAIRKGGDEGRPVTLDAGGEVALAFAGIAEQVISEFRCGR
ncbi:MAG: Mrp/NBP35 family ATP-binding protein, partial [Dissulfurimicrobium sp.]|uniref:Mrp/NBP35 family ATP-binding protein n=1 Tax=Dissulfurimicrobium sp. TaxID=2022436 RepID=UPI003D12ADEC